MIGALLVGGLFLTGCWTQDGYTPDERTTRDSALAAFRDYAPTIREAEGPIAYTRTTLGELNGDDRPDVLVEFGIEQEPDGKIVDRQVAIYLGTDQGVDVVGGFNPEGYCPSIDRIEDGTVVMRELRACHASRSDTIRTHRYVVESGALTKAETP